MTYTIFRESDVQIAWRPESKAGGFRDQNGNSTLDETNPGTGTWYYFPIKNEGNNIMIKRAKRTITRLGGGSRYTSRIHRGTQEDITFSLSGKMLSDVLLYYNLDGCTTTENTPTSYNTHVFTLSTETITYPPASIEVIIKLPNQGDASDTILLFTGVIVKPIRFGGALNGEIECTIDFEAAREITGTDLNTWPSLPSERIFCFNDATLTLTKGGTALNVKMESFQVEYNPIGKKLLKGDGDLYPCEPVAPSRVEFNFTAQLRLREDIIANLRLDPQAANNLDFKIKLSRNDTNDYIEPSWVDGYMELDGDPAWNDGYLIYPVKGYYNPEEAGGDFVHTSVNSYNNDRYET